MLSLSGTLPSECHSQITRLVRRSTSWTIESSTVPFLTPPYGRRSFFTAL